MLASKPTKGYPGWAHRVDNLRQGVKAPLIFPHRNGRPTMPKKTQPEARRGAGN